MMGAFEVLVRPYGALVDLVDEIGEKVVFLFKFIVFQYDQGMQIDVPVDLAFRPDDYFFDRIQNPENRN